LYFVTLVRVGKFYVSCWLANIFHLPA